MSTNLSIVVSILISLVLVFIDWNWGHILIEKIIFWRRVKITVLNSQNEPVPRAKVIVSGSGIRRTNQTGISKFYIPRHDIYGVKVIYDGFEAGHYMLEIKPGRKYQYTNEKQLTEI